jgi:LPPG:FO 2-phospho-L-lactate transferase
VKVVALAGGVGGAKLVWGLAQLLPGGDLAVIGNTGDDFHHLGLAISPDLDTLMYTLAGLANRAAGWGIEGDTWQTMMVVAHYGGPTWFQLGDRDLATHLMRTERLAAGETLTAITAALCGRLGVRPALLPMSDEPAPTMMETDEGLLAFQEWFVRRGWGPAVRRIVLPNPPPRASEAVVVALGAADLVVIAPSNPLVSVAPILHTRPVRELVAARPAVAVSPIIEGRAVRGPAAKLMGELGLEASPAGVARFYGRALLSGLVLDDADAGLIPAVEALGIAARPAATWMRTDEDRIDLARTVLEWGRTLL